MRQPTLNATAQSLVQRVRGYATVLRDDGVGYGDYIEQITYLLFLKMADEQARAPNAPAASAFNRGLGRRPARNASVQRIKSQVLCSSVRPTHVRLNGDSCLTCAKDT